MATVAIELPMPRIAAFCQAWRITELALFGSVLRADFAPASDVDVLVSFAADADWSLLDLMRAQDELAEILGRNVDLVEKQSLRNPFRRSAILSTRQVIYAA